MKIPAYSDENVKQKKFIENLTLLNQIFPLLLKISEKSIQILDKNCFLKQDLGCEFLRLT